MILLFQQLQHIGLDSVFFLVRKGNTADEQVQVLAFNNDPRLLFHLFL